MHMISGMLCTPVCRISVAVIASVLIHAVIFLLPQIPSHHDKILIPPLTIRLEGVSIHTNSVEKKQVQLNDSVAEVNPWRRIGVSASDVLKSKKMEGDSGGRPLPGNLYLLFSLHQAVEGRSGEVLHRLILKDDAYTLTAIKNIQGRFSDQFVQISQGIFGGGRIVPQSYTEKQIHAGGNKSAAIKFNWEDKNIKWVNGAVASLPVGAQDELSYMYQFSQMNMKKEIVRFPVVNLSNLQIYEMEVGAEEEIDTPFGKLHALHLRKIHARDEAYFELWLGMEYRLLPVKLRQVNAAGEVVEEMVVSDIRASDQ